MWCWQRDNLKPPGACYPWDTWLWLVMMALVLHTTLWMDLTPDPHAKWIHSQSELWVWLCQATGKRHMFPNKYSLILLTWNKTVKADLSEKNSPTHCIIITMLWDFVVITSLATTSISYNLYTAYHLFPLSAVRSPISLLGALISLTMAP